MNMRSLLLAILCLWPLQAQAQLLSPDTFLGYALGDAFTPHHRLVAYFEHVATEAAHVTLETYGKTNEGRPLLYAIVSSPANMARLDTIRTNNLKMAGLADGAPEGDTPAIVWLSYNVHGNESVSSEASMATLYSLAGLEHEDAQEWLRRSVVILDPCINPDGRERYVAFFRRTAGRYANPLPEAREHHEPWPGGRTNHYYFDLNRDWAWASQIETQQRLKRYNQWMPHIHVDFHEQGVEEPYYFAPAAEPYHDAITPWQQELQILIGRNHARYFDERGWLFFTRQVFDLFYPGYGDTWPIFNGAIGMTYEQGGSGRAGLGIITAEGDTLTLRERIAHHHTTSLSTIETAAAHQRRIVEEFATYFTESRHSPPGRYGTYMIKRGNGDKLSALRRHLDTQGIAYGQASREQRAEGFSYATGQTGPVTIAPGDMIVSAFQAKAVLTSVLFEPEAALSDSLSYDITAWALPYVYGLDAFALEERILPAGDLAQDPKAEQPLAKPAAFLAEWKSFEDARLLATLLTEGVTVRFSEASFTVEGRSYAPGTLIITRSGNDPLGAAFDSTVLAAAAKHGQELQAVETTLVTRGVDFGSSDVPFLKKPRIAVVAGRAAASYALGEVWHYFDQQLNYPITLVNSEDFADLLLYRYDVVVLPGGSYGGVLSEDQRTSLREWIRAGGRLVALEGAARFLAGKDGFGLKQKEKKKEEEEEEEEPDHEKALRAYADRDREAISRSVAGAVFRAHLDATHPLAFGYGDTYFTLKRDDSAFSFLKEGWNVGVLREDARVSGFAGAETLGPLENSLLFGVETMGRGEVIYLLDDPIFRGFWYNGRLLLANAIFMVGQRSPGVF